MVTKVNHYFYVEAVPTVCKPQACWAMPMADSGGPNIGLVGSVRFLTRRT